MEALKTLKINFINFTVNSETLNFGLMPSWWKEICIPLVVVIKFCCPL